jgi:tetraacyldisaccharide 4'-kinase
MRRETGYKINKWLYPISFLYGLGVRFRNYLFDNGILKSERFPIPVVCVGNLTVGGTGKTPHTEYLVRLLKEDYKVAVLSRGYKRKTSGFVLSNENSTSDEIGDEPLQIKNKFPDIVVAVDADRRRGIKSLMELPLEIRPDVILLDDAFQHRYVEPMVSIVLTDSKRLFSEDRLLPAGRLREPIAGVERADVVIVTKCNTNLKPIEFRILEKAMNLHANQEVYFTTIVYDDIKPVFDEGEELTRRLCRNKGILLIAGIANPKPFIDEATKLSSKIKTLVFSDHHRFDRGDVNKIDKTFRGMEGDDKIILTTEKDAARLKDLVYVSEEWKRKLYYMPMRIKFIGDTTFDKKLKDRIKDFIIKNKR